MVGHESGKKQLLDTRSVQWGWYSQVSTHQVSLILNKCNVLLWPNLVNMWMGWRRLNAEKMNGRGSIFLKKGYQIYIIVINTWTKGHVLLPHKENPISCRGGGMDYFSSFSFHGFTGSRGSLWGLEPLEAGQWGGQSSCVEEVSLNLCSTKLCVKKLLW